MTGLWNKDTEIRFFTKTLEEFATPEQLFYISKDNKYLAYWPKGYKGKKATLQSRNSLIGKFTEKFTADLISGIVNEKGLYAVNDAICEDIALTSKSPADVVISKKNQRELEPKDILLIIEVKMSLVWNWQYTKQGSEIILECIGDYMSHQGNPGLLRSDSMLKAIGKSINIRVSSFKASRIPIIVMGNTPITNTYYDKVDHLKTAGIIQGFCSINPLPISNKERNIKSTKKNGFYRFDNYEQLRIYIEKILSKTYNFFSSMKSNEELGKIIELADKKSTYEEKAEEFLRLIRDEKKAFRELTSY